MTNFNITGRLLYAKRVSHGTGHILVGEIYNDRRGQFPDGVLISTSRVEFEDGPIVSTRNSIYEIMAWAPGERLDPPGRHPAATTGSDRRT